MQSQMHGRAIHTRKLAILLRWEVCDVVRVDSRQ